MKNINKFQITKINRVQSFDSFLEIEFESGKLVGRIVFDGQEALLCLLIDYDGNVKYYPINKERRVRLWERFRLKLLYHQVIKLKKIDGEMLAFQTIKNKDAFTFSESSVVGEWIGWSKGTKLSTDVHYVIGSTTDSIPFGDVLKYGRMFKSYLDTNRYTYKMINGVITYKENQLAITNIVKSEETDGYDVYCNVVDGDGSGSLAFHFTENHQIVTIHTYVTGNNWGEHEEPFDKNNAVYELVPIVQKFVNEVSK